MANYVATNYVTTVNTVAEAVAAIEAYLETPLDSTTQAAWLIKIIPDFDYKYKVVIIHKDV